MLQQNCWRKYMAQDGDQTHRRMVGRAVYEDGLGRGLVLRDGVTGTAKTVILKLGLPVRVRAFILRDRSWSKKRAIQSVRGLGTVVTKSRDADGFDAAAAQALAYLEATSAE